MSNELVQFKNDSLLLADRYRFLKPLQVGSYGEVVLGLDTLGSSNNNTTGSKKQVAIKAMSKQQRGAAAIARHELSILKRLSHTHHNLCSLEDHFETEGFYWLVFEYCENGDLYDYIANPANDSHRLHFKTLIKEMYHVISHAHAKGVYHRDIKPENILIDGEKSFKLADWGLSTLSINAIDPLIGTEKYMAPETFFKQGKEHGKTISYNTKFADYWSLGITLLYFLFKRCPWKIANMSDPNFSRFVADPLVLFEWYPSLSKFGFDCILTLLQLNPTYRSLDYFFQLSCVKGYSYSFTVDDNEAKKEPLVSVMEVSASSSDEDEDDDLLFGMDLETPVVSTFKTEFSPETIEDLDFDQLEEEAEEDLFDTADSLQNTPFTPAIQTPLIKIQKPVVVHDGSYKKIHELHPDVIKNSPLKFEKLDWY